MGTVKSLRESKSIRGNHGGPIAALKASTFGLETNYFGVSPCCSESNYVQLLGGTSFPNVQSDDAYWKNSAGNAPNLISQLDQAGVNWKAYPLDPQNQHLVSVGDAYLGQLVHTITNAGFWAKGNNAIIITFDEGDDSQGCCDANPGAGQVATVVVSSHGPRGVTDGTATNHYSTLSSIQGALGLPCLNFTCDTQNVKPLSPLLAIAGSPAIATAIQPQLTWPTPTPSQPPEPLSVTPPKHGAGGWSVDQAQLLGTDDNSLGAIAGSSPSDVWAVGDYLPDATNSNRDATLTFAEHFDGTQWTVSRTPNAGPNFNTLFARAAGDRRPLGHRHGPGSGFGQQPPRWPYEHRRPPVDGRRLRRWRQQAATHRVPLTDRSRRSPSSFRP
jgi:hypothetical protein